MRKRAILPVLALVVLLGGLAAAALLWLRPSGDVTPTSGDDGSAPSGRSADAGQGEGPGGRALSKRRQTQRELVATRHDRPWPYADFSDDINELKRPRRRDIVLTRDQLELRLGRKLGERKVTVRLDNATPADVIAELTRQFAADGIRVYTRDPPVENDPVFERFYMTDVSVWNVIESMRVRTNDLVTFAVTPSGLCIGSKSACRNARIDATHWEEEQVGRGDPDDAFAEFVTGTYRPDFRDAHIGYVVRDVKEKTGIEIVVDAELWSQPVTLTWTADPMPTLAALRQIAIKLGGGLFAKDGRVFMLGR